MESVAQLEEHLSDPPASVVESIARVEGDLIILGVSGKMGPTLARMAERAMTTAGVTRRVIGVARFADTPTRDALEQQGIETIAADLTDPKEVANLPDAPNVILMVGQKFGTTGQEAHTWAVNVLAPAYLAERYATSRLVALSTGNVYPLWPTDSSGPTEGDSTGPLGEYAQSALGRERVLTHTSERNGTAITILRLNYANECRYGILHDLAQCVVRKEPIDLTMGFVNLIWQRDTNAIVLRALDVATSPPKVLNLTGLETLSVRSLATQIGTHLGVEPRFTSTEAPTALLSDARHAAELFGPPPTSLDQMLTLVTDWVAAGKPSLSRPTHYQTREGAF